LILEAGRAINVRHALCMVFLFEGARIMIETPLVRRVVRKALTCAAIGMLAAASWGQTAGTGTITGTVTDSSGAVIPNATVVITNTDTGVARTIQTNSDGSYTATFLQPGHYEVVVGGGAFGKFDQRDINLTVGRTLAINASLAAASVSSEVVVSGEAPVLDTQKTEVSQTVGQQLISNLPVNGRRWDDFVLLTPNVVPDGGSGLVAFHGISGLYNQNYVDGANNNEMLFSEARGRASGAPYVYSLDSIKEFEAETSNYSAEFGQAAGGQVNAITVPAPTPRMAISFTTCVTQPSTRSILTASGRPCTTMATRSCSRSPFTSNSSLAAAWAVRSSKTSFSTSSPMTAFVG
jgi:Carboxypeptidase regulatory-like domain